jgi:4-hydroxy-tetrahydrodipicolinate reductase
VKVAIVGSNGRMGQRLVALAEESSDINVVVQVDAGGASLDAFDDLACVIDFSIHEQSTETAAYCVRTGTPLVLGTTGLTDTEQAAIDAASQHIPMVMAPNFSVGVNLLFAMVGEAAKMLGEDFDIEVLEAHHRRKVDAPSGTAVRLGEVLAEAIGRSYDDAVVCGREGQVGARSSNEIGMSVVRGGDVVGEHTVFYLGDGEQISIGHRATDRDVFVRGALRAARWVARQTEPGLYDMGDVLRS